MFTLDDLTEAQRQLKYPEEMINLITNMSGEGLRQAYMNDPDIHAIVYLAIQIRHHRLHHE